MNKVYRVIWNASSGVFVAVSELSKSKAKSSKTRTIGSVTAAGLMVTFSAGAFAAGAPMPTCIPNDGFTPNTTNSLYGQNIVCDWNTTYSTLVGNNITAAGNSVNLVAVGNDISTGGERSTVLGSKITHSGRFTTVIGQNIKSNTEHSIVMGEDTTIDGGNYDISIGGNQNISNSHRTVALGNNIKTSESLDSLAAGNNTAITNSRLATAVGDETSVKDSTASSAFGAGSSIKKADHSTAVGAGASVNESNSSFAGGEKASVTGGYGDIAIGSSSTVSNANQSTAIGYQSSVTGTSRGMALGTLANVTDSYGGTALGASTSVSSSIGSSAIGSNSSVTGGSDSSAIGKGASVSGSKNSTAVGTSASVTSSYFALASGASANVTDSYGGTALGASTSVSSSIGSSAIGSNSSVTGGSDSSAIGKGASVSGSKNSTAVGTSASVTSSYFALASGASANVTNGFASSASGNNASVTDSSYAQADGAGAKVTNSGSATAVGNGANITNSNQASAFGVNSSITSSASGVAIGNNAKLNSAADGIAIGSVAKASAASTIALGNQAEASVFQSIALGSSAKASAADTVALGTGSIASGNSAIALGNKAQALGSNSISIGKGNIVSGNNSAAIGDPSNISGNNSYSLGNNNTIATDNTFVVGSGVTVNTAANTVNGNVILGNLSADKAYVQVSNGTINGKTYNYAGTAAGVVSVGAIGAERQIVNVAPGAITATSTDAINGSQLYATNAVVGQVADDAAKALGTTINPATGGINAPTYITNNPVTSAPTTNNNVGDAIKNLNAAVNSPLTFTDATTGSSTNPLGSTFKIEGDQNITTVVSQGQAKIQLNPDLTGMNSITLGNTILNQGGLTVGGPTGPSITTNGINAGDKAITNVAPGVNGTDAVNVNQLTKAQAAATTKVAGDKGVTVSPSTNPDGSTTYTVAAKTDGVTTQVDSNGNIAAVTTGLTNTGTGTVATPTAPNALATAGDIANAINNAGFNLQANGDTKSLVKTGDTVQFLDGDNIKITRAGNDITVATAKNVTFDSVTAGPVVINSTGINAGNTQIKGVKAGTAGTDAVNVDQLTKAQAAATTKVAGDKGVTVSPSTNPDGSTTYTVAAKTDGVTTQVDSNGNIAAVTTGLTNTGTGTVATPTAPNALATAGDIANAINNAGFNLQANGDTKSLVKTGDTVQFLDGDNIKITRAGNDITVATAKNVTFDSVTAGPVVINSTGINAGNTQIKDVKAGTAGTDAVNVDQLTKAQAAATTKVAGDKGVTVSPSTNPDGSTTYTVAAKTDGVTTQVDSNGNIAAVTTGLTNTGTGTVATPTAPNALATAGDIANAINNAGFNLQANGDTKSLVKTGDTVQFLDGDNIKITRAGNDITVATAKNVTFDSVTAGPVVINSTGINAGNTQIKDVKAGTAGTDAVNVDQLTKAQAAATTKVAGDKGVTVSPSTNPDGSTTYTVAAKTDGVTTQVDSNGNIAAVTTGLTNTGTGTVATPTAPNALATAGDIANAINNAGFNLQANGDTKSLVKTGDTVQFLDGDNIKITRAGNDITVATAKNVTFDSVTAGPVVINSTGINAGNTQIKDVKAGTAGTDAVNVDQLTKAQAAATTKVAGDKGVTVSPSTNPDGSTTYTVAAKTDGVTTQVDSNGNIAAVTTGLTNTGTGTVATPTAPNALATAGDIANAINNAGFNLQANGDTKSLVKTGDTVQFLDGDNIKITRAGNDITVATAKNVTFDSVTAGPVVINSTGINAGNTQIKDVKAGTAGTDAVNVDQLTKAQAAATTKVAGDKGVTVSPSTNPDGSTTYTVAAKTDGVTTQVDSNGNIAAVTTGLTNTGTGTVATPTAPNALATAGDIANAINNAGFNLQANGDTKSLVKTGDTVQFLDGDNIKITRAGNDITVATAKNVTFDSVTAGPVVINSTGINAGNTQIKDVKAGTAGTDAVNVDQLTKAQAAATTKVAGDKGVTVSPSTNPDGSTTYTVAAKTDGVTTQVDSNGNIAAVTTGLTNTGTGTVATPTAPNALATAGDIANAINNAGFNLQANGDTKSLVKTGDTVQFLDGDNIKITRAGNDITVATAKNVTFDSVTAGPVVINSTGINAGNTQIKDVKAGTAGTDAVNVDQLTKAQAAATTKVAGDKGVTVSPSTNPDGSTTYTVAAKTDGVTTQVDSNGNIAAVTTTFTPSTDGKVGAPVGNGDSLVTANTVADAINNSGWKATSGATGSGVVDGTTEELINPSETVTFRAGDNMVLNQAENVFTYSLNKDININSVQFNNGPKITNDGNNIKIGDKDGNATKITNVAAGTGDNDAVNVSQLKAVEATANKGWNLTTNGKADSKSNVKPGDTVDFANTDGNVKIENKGNNVIVNLNKDIDLTKDGSVTIGDTKVNNDGLTIAGGPSVTKSGIDAGDKKITNVAPGKISADSKDAINGSQLYTVQQAAVAAKTEVKAGDNVEVKKESGGNGQDIYTVSAKDTSASVTAGSDAITVNKADPKKVVTVDVTDYKVDLSQATKDNIQKGVDAKGIVDNKGLTFAGDNNSSTEVQKLGSTVNVNGDSNITTQASGNTVKVTLNPNVTVESLTATNSVNVGSGNAQVALTTNVGKDDVRELSVGSANAPTRITNVARGVNDTDAVNLSQLKDLGYNINTKIDKVEKEANAGIASAMAMETAPFIAGKWTYAVGAAYHGGEQAVGATLRKTADNGRWSLTGGVATGTEGDPSVRIGISGVID